MGTGLSWGGSSQGDPERASLGQGHLSRDLNEEKKRVRPRPGEEQCSPGSQCEAGVKGTWQGGAVGPPVTQPVVGCGKGWFSHSNWAVTRF